MDGVGEAVYRNLGHRARHRGANQLEVDRRQTREKGRKGVFELIRECDTLRLLRIEHHDGGHSGAVQFVADDLDSAVDGDRGVDGRRQGATVPQ